MKLVVTTPTQRIVDSADVAHLRAEDESGAFGIEPGHADLLTVLSASVITWRDTSGTEHHVAVRGGLLTVRDGTLVEVATRDAVGEKTLAGLGSAVLERFRADEAAEIESRVSATRLHLATIRQLQRYAQSRHQPTPSGLPPDLAADTEPGDLGPDDSP